MNTTHTIENAIFQFALDPALLPWPDLANDIEAQLRPVVEMVFDAAEGGFALATLEVDLGVTRFDGSWDGLRDRLSDAVRNALQRHRLAVSVAADPMPASNADLARNTLEQALEEIALAGETAKWGLAARRLGGLLQGHGGLESTPTFELKRWTTPLDQVLLQCLAHETWIERLLAAGFVEPLATAEMNALIAALVGAIAEDGADRSIDAKTGVHPQSTPQSPPALMAPFAASVDLPEATPPGQASDLAPSKLGEAAMPSRWRDRASEINKAADAVTSIWPTGACGDTTGAAAPAAKALVADIDAEHFAAAYGLGICHALVQGLLEPPPQGHAGETPKIATKTAAAGADTATLQTAIDRRRRTAADERAFLAGIAIALAQGADLDLEALGQSAAAPSTPSSSADGQRGGPRREETPAPPPEGAVPDPRAFIMFLTQGAAQPRARLIHAVESGMTRSPVNFAQLMRTALRDVPACERYHSVVRRRRMSGKERRASDRFVDEQAILRLVGLLPEYLLRRCALLLRPATAPLLLKLFDLFGNALLTHGFACEWRNMMARCWSTLFRHLLVNGDDIDLRRFVADIMATVAPNQVSVRRVLAAVLATDRRPKEAAELRQAALALLERAGDMPDAGADPISALSAAAIAHSDVVLVAEESAGIDNAGIVLAAPFMPRLFTLLDLLDQNIFKTPEAALHAARVLQYLVDGRAEIGWPPRLNRILCGGDAARPQVNVRPLGAFEMDTVDGLVAMMIERWRSIGNTSSTGLREAFLQRPGRLLRRQEEWRLRVEPRAYDMLLDQLPWSFSIIKHPWMRSPIHVAWR